MLFSIEGEYLHFAELLKIITLKMKGSLAVLVKQASH